jgi:heme-degrading monooxygenase HmoA
VFIILAQSNPAKEARMNQVMEQLRLAPGATESEAITRLSTLFEMMSRAKGFREAEVLHSLADPGLLLVLHSWDRLEDWTTFQTSDTKIAFSSSRPAFLYNFMPCGMNWKLEDGAATGEGSFVRREVIQEALEPRSGPDVVSSQTFSYRDYEADLTGAMLRLSRSNAAPSQLRAIEGCVLTDDVYEHVHRHSAVSHGVEVVG